MESLAKFVVFLFLFIFTIISTGITIVSKFIIYKISNDFSVYWWFILEPIILIVSVFLTIFVFKLITKLSD